MARPPKIAVIGTTPVPYRSSEFRIDSFLFSRLQQRPNLRDYDVLILNLLDIQSPSDIDWLGLQAHLDFGVMTDIVENSGLVVVLGDPRLSEPNSGNQLVGGRSMVSTLLNWTGAEFIWDDKKGDTVIPNLRFEAETKRLGRYLSHLAHWEYSLDAVRARTELFDTEHEDFVTNAGWQAEAEIDIHATTRFKNALAFTFRVVLKEGLKNRKGPFPMELSIGPVLFLPAIELPSAEALGIVLQDVCGVPVAQEEPEWATAIMAPQQQPIDQDLTCVDEQLNQLQQRRVDLEGARADVRRYLGLLYEQGDALEVLVRHTLRYLGATVHEPEARNEDGRLEVEVDGSLHYAVLEVKGVGRRHHEKKGLRQLDEWKDLADANHSVKHKGLFFGNASINLPPSERVDPFNPDWKRTAERNEICAMTTETLYRAYEMDTNGLLDRDHFWRTVFNTNGILPEDALPN